MVVRKDEPVANGRRNKARDHARKSSPLLFLFLYSSLRLRVVWTIFLVARRSSRCLPWRFSPRLWSACVLMLILRCLLERCCCYCWLAGEDVRQVAQGRSEELGVRCKPCRPEILLGDDHERVAALRWGIQLHGERQHTDRERETPPFLAVVFRFGWTSYLRVQRRVVLVHKRRMIGTLLSLCTEIC